MGLIEPDPDWTPYYSFNDFRIFNSIDVGHHISAFESFEDLNLFRKNISVLAKCIDIEIDIEGDLLPILTKGYSDLSDKLEQNILLCTRQLKVGDYTEFMCQYIVKNVLDVKAVTEHYNQHVNHDFFWASPVEELVRAYQQIEPKSHNFLPPFINIVARCNHYIETVRRRRPFLLQQVGVCEKLCSFEDVLRQASNY